MLALDGAATAAFSAAAIRARVPERALARSSGMVMALSTASPGCVDAATAFAVSSPERLRRLSHLTLAHQVAFATWRASGLVNGCAARFLLDSGANVCIASRALVRAVRAREMAIPPYYVRGVNSNTPFVAAAVVDVSVGGEVIRVETLVADETPAPGVDMILANAVVARLRDDLDTLAGPPPAPESDESVSTLAGPGSPLVCLATAEAAGDYFLDQAIELYERTFAAQNPNPERMPATDIWVHDIEVIDDGKSVRIFSAPRRFSKVKFDAIRAQVTRWLLEGVVVPSTARHRSEFVVARKPHSDELRVCLDLRELNRITRIPPARMPTVASIAQRLAGKRVFSTLDLSQAFLHFRLTARASDLTTFEVPGMGVYKFARMPFGMAGAPSTCQRAVESVLRGFDPNEVHLYMDDILIATDTSERHQVVFKHVVAALAQANLRVNWKKCVLRKARVPYLGLMVSADGVSVNPERVQAVLAMQPPSTLRGVRSLLGALNFYSAFVENLQQVVEPLNELTRGRGLTSDAAVEWTPRCEEAWRAACAALSRVPTLAFPDWASELHLTTDASNFAIGAVLEQSDCEGRRRPLAFFSRSLNRAQRNYSATQREALALVSACEHFRDFIETTATFVHTDHKPLVHILQGANASPMLGRWFMSLLDLPLNFSYVRGEDNVVADLLSRYADARANMDAPMVVAAAEAAVSWEQPPVLDHVAVAHAEFCARQRVAIPPSLPPESVAVDANGFVRVHKDGAWRVVVHAADRVPVLRALHEHYGHVGAVKLRAMLRRWFYWRGWWADALTYVRACDHCQRAEGHVRSATPAAPFYAEYPLELLCVDLLDVNSALGHKCLVAIDVATRRVFTHPIEDKTAPVVAAALTSVVLNQMPAWPHRVHSDRGGEFTAHLVQELLKRAQAKASTTPAYTPQANGVVERVHQSILHNYRAAVRDARRPIGFDEALALATATYNSTPHEALAGSAPNDVFYNCERAASHGGKSKAPVWQQPRVVVGAEVLVFDSAAATTPERKVNLNKWRGPFIVQSRSAAAAVLRSPTGATDTVSFRRIKPYYRLPQHLLSEAGGSVETVRGKAPVGVLFESAREGALQESAAKGAAQESAPGSVAKESVSRGIAQESVSGGAAQEIALASASKESAPEGALPVSKSVETKGSLLREERGSAAADERARTVRDWAVTLLRSADGEVKSNAFGKSWKGFLKGTTAFTQQQKAEWRRRVSNLLLESSPTEVLKTLIAESGGSSVGSAQIDNK